MGSKRSDLIPRCGENPWRERMIFGADGEIVRQKDGFVVIFCILRGRVDFMKWRQKS